MTAHFCCILYKYIYTYIFASTAEEGLLSKHPTCTIYSQVHKCWDFNKVTVSLAVYPSILVLKLNYEYDLKVHTFI